MAALHEALTTLGPADFSNVPQDPAELTAYLHSAFRSAQVIVDSVPLPAPSELSPGRPRSQTTTSQSSTGSELFSSTARSELLNPGNAHLQKEWGKPLKTNAKDNPLDIATYKLAGKDGKGAWFARRSVHEGMGFKKWHLGLKAEFPETLEVQGGPGEGNIRGIGGERRVEDVELDGVGKEEVYHLTAQFPGPSSPRDFVTLLLTSSNALSPAGADSDSKGFTDYPRHFMVISRPCIHPDCPPRTGFVRGQYESVEFIREIPRKPKKSASALALDKQVNSASHEDQHDGRSRSKTISFAGTRGSEAKGEKVDHATEHEAEDDDEEQNPVEWIMITRSDPGGNVPRFLVERGTPGSIIADASKFVDWATKKEHPSELNGTTEKEVTQDLETGARLKEPGDQDKLPIVDESQEEEPETSGQRLEREETQSPKLEKKNTVSRVTEMAVSSLETYAPQAVVDRLPGHEPSAGAQAPSAASPEAPSPPSSRSSSPTASMASFFSAEDRMEDSMSTEAPSSHDKGGAKIDQALNERELTKLNERKRALNEKLAKAKEKEVRDREELTAKEQERIRKAEEKHARDVAKEEARYSKQIAKLEAKKRKSEEKDEKTRMTREIAELKSQLDGVRQERDLLQDQVGLLQKENTSLVSRLGKLEEGKDLLKDIKAETLEGNRSRSSSLRKMRPSTPDKGKASPSALKENLKPS